MPKGFALNIGLNYVDPDHYDGWDGELIAAENDAKDMNSILTSQGFNATIMLREEAKRENVLNFISNIAQNSDTDDIFILTYSGHGGQIPDLGGDETDELDETICLFDGELLDDELYNLWKTFKEGIRILILADDCHSGTLSKFKPEKKVSRVNADRIKEMPRKVEINTYLKNKEFYDKIKNKTKSEKENKKDIELMATVKLISGCQDNQVSYDGNLNGAFTGKLKSIWDEGNFSGNYSDFHHLISEALEGKQSPNYSTIGKDNAVFNEQKPFTI